MNIPFVSCIFEWSDRDIALLLMFLGILFIIWLVGLAGVGIFIFGLFLLIKPSK